MRLDTSQPLKKAAITLENRSAAANSAYDVTDERGHFSVQKVVPGSYRLVVSRNGFVDAEYGQKRVAGSGAVLTLSAGQRMTDLVFKLACTAALSGHVYDEDGEPVRGATITVFRAASGQGKPAQIGNQPTETNDLGEFRVFDLPPGRYLVSVFYHARNEWRRTSHLRTPDLGEGYLPSFYPNTTDASKAQPIVIRAGDDIRSLDFFLHPASLVSVSGRVLMGFPTTANTAVGVYLNPRGSGLVPDMMNLSGSTDPQTGTFRIDSVPPGSYSLGTSYRDRDLGVWLHTRQDLDVGNFDVEGITLTLLPGIDVPGRVRWEAPPPSAPRALQVRLSPTDNSVPGQQRQMVKPDGTIVLKNISEGEYRAVVMFGDHTPVGFLKSARYGSRPLTDSVLTVRPGSDAFLELALSACTAQVSGTVLTSDSLLAVGVQVVLIPEEPRRDNHRKFRSETTDQNGKFTIAGLEPGNGKLFSWDIAEEGDEPWFEPDWLKPFEGDGTSIRLGESDTKTLQLHLLDLPKDSNPQ